MNGHWPESDRKWIRIGCCSCVYPVGNFDSIPPSPPNPSPSPPLLHFPLLIILHLFNLLRSSDLRYIWNIHSWLTNTHATLLNQHIPLSIYIHISAKSWCDFCCENYKFMVKFIERTSSASCLSQHTFVVQLQTQINTYINKYKSSHTHSILFRLYLYFVIDGGGAWWQGAEMARSILLLRHFANRERSSSFLSWRIIMFIMFMMSMMIMIFRTPIIVNPFQ